MKDTSFKVTLVGFILIFMIMLSLNLPLLKETDISISDSIYQTGYCVSDNRIIIVAIDGETLHQLGNIGTWNRERYATLISRLYSEDSAPSVVGVDVEFSGPYNGDFQDSGDAFLTKTLTEHSGIVLANHLIREKDGVRWSESLPSIKNLDQKGQISIGYTNLFLDSFGKEKEDAVVRHSVYQYQGKYKSFAYQVASEDGKVRKQENSENTEREYLLYAGAAETNPEYYGTSFEKISFWSVYKGDIPVSRFKNKIVLIGAYEAGLQDEYPTAISYAERMAGVEIQANMINALIDPNYQKLAEVNDWIQYLFLFFLLSVFLVFFQHRKLTTLFAIWALFTAGSFCFALCIKDVGFIIHPLWLPYAITILMIWEIIIHYYQEAKQKMRIRMQFGRYVDDSVLQKILQDEQKGLEPGRIGERKEVAILFSDICGFTTMSEKNTPEETVEILNRYFEILTRCIAKYHGTIDKFIGDAAMVIWNAPKDQKDYIELAIHAAEEIILEIKKDETLSIHVAIGIDCGTVVIGNIGSKRRMDYTVIGDSVNTASRLESLKLDNQSREDQIYFSDSIYKKMREKEYAELLGFYPVRGKQKSIAVYKWCRFWF